MAEGHKIEDLLAQIPPHEFAAHEKCLKNIYLVLALAKGIARRYMKIQVSIQMC